MSNLYIKNKKNEYLPIDINSVLNKDLNNRLIIIRVGTDEHPASPEDLNETLRSFSNADVLELNDVSIVLTPYQISLEILDEADIENKPICLQITGGEDISMLEEQIRRIYKRIKKQHSNVTILPSPLKVKDYRQVVETLKRSQLRKERRGLARR